MDPESISRTGQWKGAASLVWRLDPDRLAMDSKNEFFAFHCGDTATS
jgi:hypothetical protein